MSGRGKGELPHCKGTNFSSNRLRLSGRKYTLFFPFLALKVRLKIAVDRRGANGFSPSFFATSQKKVGEKFG
jgi:hypothetical protein